MKKCMKKILMANIAAAIICSVGGGVASAQDSLYDYDKTPVSIENNKLVKGDAYHNDAATTDIQTSNMTGTADQYYGHFFWGDVTVKDTHFDNNALTSGGPNGGAAYFNSCVQNTPTNTYWEVEEPNKVIISNSTFNGNKIESTDTHVGINAASKAGAVMIKGTNVTFNDVAFNDNVASGGSQAQGMGGAIYLDSTANKAYHDNVYRVLKASATFNVTQDTTYAGNKASGVDASYSDTYGSYAKTGGGFMYMDRGGEANFNVADGVTLKIGKDGETDANTDSIASAIRGSNAKYGENTINKQGLGTLTVNGSMSGYHGDLNVKEGTMNINQSLAGDAKISVSDGATLNLKEVELSSQSGSISVTNAKGTQSSVVTLPAKDGSLVAESGSKVTAKTITLKNKSSMKVDTGATVTADSVAVKDDATLSTAVQSKLNVKTVSVDPAKEGNVQLRGDFKGALTDSNGNVLTAEDAKKVMKKATGDNSRVDIEAQNGKSATSLLQGDDGSFTIQNKDYANGGATKVLASYDKDGTYDAHGNDMKNVGAISTKSLSVGQIGDVETAIKNNADGIKQNATAIQNNADRIQNNADRIQNNADRIQNNADRIQNNADRIQNNADRIHDNADRIQDNAGAIQQNKAAIQQNAAGIQRLDGRIDKVGANAAALAALHPLDYDASEKWSVAAGVGNYGSENAMAVGAFYRPNEDVMLNMAGSFGSGENMVNAGISFKVGQRGAKVVKAEGADVKALQEKVEAQDKEIQELREMVEKLAAKA